MRESVGVDAQAIFRFDCQRRSPREKRPQRDRRPEHPRDLKRHRPTVQLREHEPDRDYRPLPMLLKRRSAPPRSAMQKNRRLIIRPAAIRALAFRRKTREIVVAIGAAREPKRIGHIFIEIRDRIQRGHFDDRNAQIQRLCAVSAGDRAQDFLPLFSLEES